MYTYKNNELVSGIQQIKCDYMYNYDNIKVVFLLCCHAWT